MKSVKQYISLQCLLYNIPCNEVGGWGEEGIVGDSYLCVRALSGRYLLNCLTICNQILHAGESSSTRIDDFRK